jgi:hypothetical protein
MFFIPFWATAGGTICIIANNDTQAKRKTVNRIIFLL